MNKLSFIAKSVASLLLVVLFSTCCRKNTSPAGNDNKKPEQPPADAVLSYDVVELETSFGNILIWLYDETPKHKANFLSLVKNGTYDNTTFHRIIKNFMIQGGDPNSKDNDPTNDGQGGPGYTIDPEFNAKITHTYGAVAAARMGDQVNPGKKSSGSQFYIVNNQQGTHFLDMNYTVFGTVISGMDVVEKISDQPKGQFDRPVNNITMKVKIVKITADDLKTKYNFVIPVF